MLVVDTDRTDPGAATNPFRIRLPSRLSGIGAAVQFACAQQHLEAWYFADIDNLRAYIGRSPGRIDTTKPDLIDNPKEHLKNLLGNRVYTAQPPICPGRSQADWMSVRSPDAVQVSKGFSPR